MLNTELKSINNKLAYDVGATGVDLRVALYHNVFEFELLPFGQGFFATGIMTAFFRNVGNIHQQRAEINGSKLESTHQ